ncbi:MAG: hypothetical protein D6759_19770, partial [Chloroflexi bacterium]
SSGVLPSTLPPAAPTAEALTALREALRDLGRFCEAHPDLNEREVITYAFRQAGLFAALGYDRPGEDVLLEHHQADVVLRALHGRPLAVIEFKRPSRSPNEGLEQLERRYVGRLLPDVGVLCNGRELWLYRRTGDRLYHPPALRITLAQADDAQALALYRWLGRRSVDLSRLETFAEALRALTRHPIPVHGPAEPGGRAFLTRFALEPGTPFGRLVAAMAAALPGLLRRSGFTQGAYAFWRRIYARELKGSGIPPGWRALMPTEGREEEGLYHLMFALESAYALLSRLMLARAMENHGFPDLELADSLIGALKPRRRHGRLPPEAYAHGLRELFDYAGRQAFQALFASDIFDWWHDLGRSPNAAPVGERLAEAILAVFEFDFRPMSGDLLSSLYQSYFDPETRKALGEFYTPPEVADFILDQVGYRPENPQVITARLLDPACGSGTFLVHALQRYLAANRGRPAGQVLRELLGGLKIVGFDVNPFAVLMAQINYAAQVLPLCAQALREGELPTPLTLPVLRTDSLRQEYREGEQTEVRPGTSVQSDFFHVIQEEQVTRIKAELPVEVEPGRFFATEIPVPRYDRARAEGWVYNAEEYFFALHVLFEAVAEGKTKVAELAERLERADLPHPRPLARYIRPAAVQLVAEMERLRDRYEDGRFLKTLADLALALVLKNDVWYDYVVGNPPYIRIQAIPRPLRERWEGWYTWAAGNFDAYIPFLERAIHVAARPVGPNLHEWLRPGGRLGFICSNRFLVAGYAEEMRAALPRHGAVELLVDMRDSRVFEEALNYPAILIVRRLAEGEEPPATVPVVRVFDDPRQGAAQLIEEARHLLAGLGPEEPYRRGEVADAFLADRADLKREAWLPMPPQERRLFRRLEAAATVAEAEVCPVCRERPPKARAPHPHVLRLQDLTLTQSGAFQGIATGDDPALVFRLLEERGERLLLRPKGADRPDWRGPKVVEMERAVLRPWLFGRDVERWHIAWDGWYVFFPYAPIEALERRGGASVAVTRYRLIPTAETVETFRRRHGYLGEFPLLDRDYPLAWRYVTHPAIEARLRGRERGRRARGTREAHLWYGLGRPQNLELYERPKLLVQVASPAPDFAFDEDRHFLIQHGGRGGGT